MVFVPTLLAGGYVTDMLLTISFEAETWDELNLGEIHTPCPLRWYFRSGESVNGDSAEANSMLSSSLTIRLKARNVCG